MKLTVLMRGCRFSVVAFGVGVFLFSVPGWSRQESTSSPVPAVRCDAAARETMCETAAQATESSSHDAGTSLAVSNTPPNAPPIRKMGSASLLDSISPLRWGNLFIGSAEFAQIYTTLDPRTGDGITSNISLFRSHIYYDKQFQRARLALQYQPRVMIVNGQVIRDLLNQNLNLDTYFVLSPRWVMGLGETFSYYGSKNVYGDSFLDADSITATTVQNNFVQGSGQWLSSSTGASFNYLWSAHTKLSISPSFTYTYATILSENVEESRLSSRGYDIRATITHDMNANRSLGAYYGFQYLTSPTAFSSTIYETFGGTVSQRFSPTFAASGSIGATTGDFSSGRQWTVAVSVSAVKSFDRSSIAVAYTRGETLAGYVTNQFGERIDARWVKGWSQKLQSAFGVGYQREIANPTGIWAKYGTARLTYRLRPQLGLSAEYVHRLQTGSNPQIFTGNNDFIMFGITWAPVRNSAQQ